jgi:hypothetical protein
MEDQLNYKVIMNFDVDYKQIKPEEMKTPETKYTKNELRYNEIHKELLKLELYQLADKLSLTFYGYGSEQFKEGIDEMKRINNLYK